MNNRFYLRDIKSSNFMVVVEYFAILFLTIFIAFIGVCFLLIDAFRWLKFKIFRSKGKFTPISDFPNFW